MNIWRAAPAGVDFGVLADLHARAFAGWGQAWTASDLRACAMMAGGTLLIAGRDTEAAGFSLLSGCGDDYDLLTLAVHPVFQRQGVGRSLIEQSVETLRQDNVTRITLEVAAGNAPALALYTAAGFCHIATRNRYYRYRGMVDDALVMQLLIK